MALSHPGYGDVSKYHVKHIDIQINQRKKYHDFFFRICVYFWTFSCNFVNFRKDFVIEVDQCLGVLNYILILSWTVLKLAWYGFW